MSAYKELIQTLVAAYGRHLPLRDVYFKCFHNRIAKNLGKRADGCFSDDGFIVHLAKLTGLANLNLDLSVEEKKAIVADADKSLQKRFDLLGSGVVELNPIKWSSDFIHGYEWKKGTYYREYTQVDLSNNADVKVPRELSRCHHLLRLAVAYRLTGEEKYALTVIEHITDWIKENPLMYSINWGCAMDVGIRAINWIWALSLLKDYQYKESHKKIYESLYQHGWYIYRNLEGTNWGYNNNHYFSDIVGLLHIALLFRDDKEGAEWLKFAQSTFYRETRLQILPSGMLYEGSTNYHRLVTELVLTSVVLLRRNGINVPPDIMGRLESMFDFIMQITMPNGAMPIVGDQDNGRVLPWGTEELNDHRYLLAVGAMLFDRADMKHLCTGFNIYAAVLAGSREEYETIKEEDVQLKSKLIRDAGFAVMRKDDSYLLFNVDNQGMYRDTGTAMSHTHCDWFSFVLAAKGMLFLVDPGSYVYSSDAKARNLFRSTKMHNTITIDDENQEKMPEKLLWNYKRVESPQIIKWGSNQSCDIIECEHNGYNWLGDIITHRRRVEFNKAQTSWTITDKVTSKQNHDITAHYHLDKGVEVSKVGKLIILRKGGISLELQFEGADEEDLKVVPSQLSEGYGHLMESKEIVVSKSKINDFELVTMIWERKN